MASLWSDNEQGMGADEKQDVVSDDGLKRTTEDAPDLAPLWPDLPSRASDDEARQTSENVQDTVDDDPRQTTEDVPDLTPLGADTPSKASDDKTRQAPEHVQGVVDDLRRSTEDVPDLAPLWPDAGSVSASKEGVQSQIVNINPVNTGISVLWRANLDQRHPASPEGFSQPAVIQSNQGEFIIAGAQDRRVRIYDASGGGELDRIALDAPGESGALQLSNGLVVLGDIDGMLYGIDVTKRKIAWRFAMPSVLLSKPIAMGEDFIIQTADNQLYRMTAKGEKLWSYTGILGGLSMHLSASPAVFGNNVYAVFSNGDVIALKADSGSFLWKQQLLLNTEAAVLSELKVPVSAPVIIPASQSGRDEDVLAVAVFQGETSFISLQDGTVLSQRNLSLKSSPLLVGRKLYVADANGAVSALDAANGETLWKQQISEGELVGPVLWQGSLWLADNQGMVYRLNMNGHVLASTELNGHIDRAPVVAANGVLVRNNLGTLFMLR